MRADYFADVFLFLKKNNFTVVKKKKKNIYLGLYLLILKYSTEKRAKKVDFPFLGKQSKLHLQLLHRACEVDVL